ncbi:hypothetical protein Tco_1435487 [Tanacetum coccineum]
MTAKDLLGQRDWSWPDGWTDKFPILLNMQNLRLDMQTRDKSCGREVMENYVGSELIKPTKTFFKMMLINDLDSHTYLFFDCEYSRVVWGKVTKMINVDWRDNEWRSNVTTFARRYNGNFINSIIRRLCIAASVYLIWQERNNRILRDGKRNCKDLYKVLYETIRMRLMSLRVKDTLAVRKA